MRPLMVINGILLGSSLSIAVSLTLVFVVFLVIGDDYPRVQAEKGALVVSIFIFTGMTIISAASFYTLAKKYPQRHVAQALMWTGLAATAWYYWPK